MHSQLFPVFPSTLPSIINHKPDFLKVAGSVKMRLNFRLAVFFSAEFQLTYLWLFFQLSQIFKMNSSWFFDVFPMGVSVTFLLFSRTRLGVRPSNFDAKWLNRRGFTYKFAFCNKKSKLFVTPDPQTPKPPKFGKFRSALRSKAMILIYVCVVRLQCAKKRDSAGWEILQIGWDLEKLQKIWRRCRGAWV